MTRLLRVLALAVVTACVFPFPSWGRPGPDDEDREYIEANLRRLAAGNKREDRLAVLQDMKKVRDEAAIKAFVPVLKKLLRTDPDPKVRAAVVEPLVEMVYSRPPRLCPLELLEAIDDPDEEVAIAAGTQAMWFTSARSFHKTGYAGLPTGATDVLLKCAKSERPLVRVHALTYLAWQAEHPGGDAKALAALKAARKDKDEYVRHNAHWGVYRATNRLADIVPYFVLEVERWRDEPVPDGPLEKLPEKERWMYSRRNLALLGSRYSCAEWGTERPKEFADVLRTLLADKSAETRRQTAEVIARHARTVSYPPPEGNSLIPQTDPKPKGPQPKPSAWLREHGVVAALEKISTGDPDAKVRASAAKAVDAVDKVLKGGGPSEEK